jgi:potassium-transporting ATPase KdpC subunit
MRELRTAAIALLVLTVLLGLAYPLAMTGVSQVLFPNQADGSMVAPGSSRLIGQDFSRHADDFQSRPSATGYNPAGTFFNNQGPNQKELADQLKGSVAEYLKRERPFTPGLTAAKIPPDAVTTSASGVDPQISEANARIQANRVARERHLPLKRVLAVVEDHAGQPLLGLGGPKSINVLETNRALDQEAK